MYSSASEPAGPARRLNDLASEMAALAGDALHCGTTDGFDDDALGQALATLIRIYVGRAETGAKLLPFGRNAALTPTEIAIASLALLDAGRMEVFELGLWEQMTDIRPARPASLGDDRTGVAP